MNQVCEQLRVQPHSMEAEQAVLGGLMLAPAAYDSIADLLVEENFYRRDHQLIFRAIRALAEKNRPFDTVTLGEWFDSQGLGEQIGGGAYLVELVTTASSAANIRAYAEIVRDKAVLRQLIKAGAGMVNDGFKPEGRDSIALLVKAEQEVFAIAMASSRGRQGLTKVKRALYEAFEVLQTRYNSGGGVTGLATGYTEFDKITAGLQPTDLVILAARPSMGKTTLAMNMAEYVAMKSKKPVAVFSMEGSASQLALRLISSLSRVNATRLRTGQLDEGDWSRIRNAIDMLRDLNIFIDDSPVQSTETVRLRSRQLRREHGLGMIVIDCIQKMQFPGNSENHATEIFEISRSLKALAKELGVPVIALSRLDRSLEKRIDRRPVLSDLTGCGGLEDEADMVLFIYRDEYYNRESSPDKGLAEIIIGKQRNGPTGMVKLKFSGEYLRFDNICDGDIGVFE